MATERRAAIVTGAAGGREGRGADRLARDRADADRADLSGGADDVEVALTPRTPWRTVPVLGEPLT